MGDGKFFKNCPMNNLEKAVQMYLELEDFFPLRALACCELVDL